MSQVQKLIGKKIKGISHEISRTIPMDDKPSKRMEDFDLYLQISFDEYTLNVYNKHYFNNVDKMEDLVDFELDHVEETDSKIVFHFNDNKILGIDMLDTGYTGPEALALYRPNNLVVVWN